MAAVLTVRLARWVELSEGLPFAALTDPIIGVDCLGHDPGAAARTPREPDRPTPSSDPFGGADGEPAPRQECNEPSCNGTSGPPEGA